MAFHEVQFPDKLDYGSRGGPGYRTNILVVDSGAEHRVGRWGESRRRYDVAYGVKSHVLLSQLQEFYIRRKGPLFGFRFKDVFDSTTGGDGLSASLAGGVAAANSDESIGTGDGTTTDFQLVKRYTDSIVSRIRNITKPVDSTTLIALDAVAAIDRTGTATSLHAGTQLTDTAATFTTWGIRVGQLITNSTDGSTATVTTVDSETQITHSALSGGTENDWDVSDAYTIDKGWTVNTATGLVTFTTAPIQDVAITAGCDFHVPVRFGEEVDDLLSLNIEDFSSGRAVRIPLVEIIDEGNVNDEFFYGGQKDHGSVTADLTIVENNGRAQKFNPSASGFKIKMPDPTDISGGGPKFYFVNEHASNTMAVTNAAGTTTHFTLNADTMVTVVLVGATWHAAEL